MGDSLIANATVGYGQKHSISHCFTVRNVGNDTRSIPEFVRRNVVNDIVFETGTQVEYAFKMRF